MTARDLIAHEIILRGNACQDCERPYEQKSFNWHHRDPETVQFRISAALHNHAKGLPEELAKCDLLCLSCHRRRHPNTATKTTVLTVRLGPKLREQLEREASENEMTLGEFVRYALADYLKRATR